jgi:hypothetical protein
MTEESTLKQIQDIGGHMARLLATEEWPLFEQLVSNKRVVMALDGYSDPDHPKEYYAGLLDGMAMAANIPGERVEEAKRAAEIKADQRRASYESGGKGEVS